MNNNNNNNNNNSGKKIYKKCTTSLLQWKVKKGRLVLLTNYVTVCYVSHYRDALEDK